MSKSMPQFVIVNSEANEFWSNDTGWVGDVDSATKFSDEERETYVHLPLGGGWMQLPDKVASKRRPSHITPHVSEGNVYPRTLTTKFFVGEDTKTYKLGLYREDNEQEDGGPKDYFKGQQHLYGVVLISPFGTTSCFVLASSPQDARSQATCWAQLESYNSKELPMDEFEKLIKAEVKQVPLVIRGWSRHEF